MTGATIPMHLVYSATAGKAPLHEVQQHKRTLVGGSIEALSFMLLSGGFVLAEILGPLLSSSSGASEGDWSRAAVLGSAVLPGEAQGEE